MIASLSLILLCQLAGEIIVRGLVLQMPGPVLGLLFLLLLLLARDRFSILARGPLTGEAVETAVRGLSPTCRCCSSRPASASCKSSI